MFGLMVSMVSIVLRGVVGLILGNGYGILGQNCVALLQRSEMSAWLRFKDLILGI